MPRGAAVTTLIKAALPVVPGVNQLPGIRKTGGEFTGLSTERPPERIDPDRAARYAEVCGFPVKDTVPLPYPHLLAFPMHMHLMSDPAFPVPAMGMVHLENSITSHRPIGVDETLAVSVHVDPAVPHPVGQAYRFHAQARSDDDSVWQSTSVYLRRGPRNAEASWPSAPDAAPPSGPVFRLPGDLGRQYARVSGDYNPIHLTPITAKALGFRRHIAHGMWTKARCLAALENRLPDRVRVDVAFKKPVFLPSSVAFGSRPIEDGYDFSLHRRGSDTLHLVGSVRSPAEDE